MNEAERRKRTMRHELRKHPAVRNYMLICLASLFLLVLCLVDRGLDWWSVAPASIGCLTLLTHWNHGPPLVLLSLAGLLGMPRPAYLRLGASWARLQAPSPMDCILCVAVLTYVLTHYRLLALVRRIFPVDTRYRGGKDATEPMPRRSADLVSPYEMILVGIVSPVWAGIAVLLWVGLMGSAPPLDMPSALWRALQLVWTALVLLAVGGIIAHYLRRSTATVEESLLYLQDELWRHTRREQGILNRWLTWARLRARRKKEDV